MSGAPAARWRAALLLPVPFLAWLAVARGSVVGMMGHSPRVDTGPDASGLVLAAAAVLSALAFAFARGAFRPLGYALYAMALALGFSGGLVFAAVNASGGLRGEPPGSPWLTWVLGAGAGLSALALFALIAFGVMELRSQDA